MTINDVKLIETKGTVSDEGPGYSRAYHVYYSNGYSAAALVVNTDTRLPKYGDALKNDAGTANEDSTVYCCGIDFSRHPDDGQQDDCIAVYNATYKLRRWNFDPNPLHRPPEIEWGGSELTETTRIDSEGNPIVNSAGEFYDPAPERYIPGAEVTITRNEAQNPGPACTLYSYTTNVAQWFGVAKGNALFGKITARRATEIVNGQTINYWVVTYPIRFKRDGWKTKLIDNGYMKLDDNGDAVVATDKLGQISPQPVLLDGAGGKLANGAEPVVYPAKGTPLNDESDFGGLALPSPFV